MMRIAAKLDFQENRANGLSEVDGRLSGEVRHPILGREAKAEALHDIANRLALTPADAIAVGDGANDLEMIRLAGTGWRYTPSLLLPHKPRFASTTAT